MSFIKQIKGVSQDAFVYGVGNALGRFIGVFIAPILTRIFVPSDYGVITLLQTMVGFLIILAGFNLNSGVYRHYFEYDDPEKKRIIVSTSFLFYLGAGILISGAAWLAAPALKTLLLTRNLGVEETLDYDYVRYLRILAVGILFSIMDINSRSLLRMTRQPYKYMILNILQVFINFTLIILLVVYLQQGIEGALWAGVITSIIVSLVGFFMVARYYALVFSTSFFGLFLSYSLPQFPSVLINWSLIQSNRFFLNYYSPLTEQGYYAISLKVASIFLLFSVAFRLAWHPFALSIIKVPDSITTYSRTYSFYMVVFGLLAGCISLFAKPALLILTPASYHVAYSIVFILIWAYLYMGANNILGIGIAISKRTKFISYSQAIAFMVNIALNFLLVPRFFAWGAALAFVGGIITQSLAIYFFAQYVYPIPYEFWRLHIFTFILFVVIAFEAFIVRDFNLLYSTLAAILFTPILGLLTWRVGLSLKERRKAANLLLPILAKWRLLQSTTWLFD